MRLRGDEIMGKNYKLIVGVKEDGEIVEVSAEKPNRFDPYKALDNITLESAGCSTRSYDAILEQVNALRAYITGREQ